MIWPQRKTASCDQSFYDDDDDDDDDDDKLNMHVVSVLWTQAVVSDPTSIYIT